jgi:formylglycine-generating enzyme required for sulfatase activity
MLRKALCVFILLLCMFALSACSKKADKEKEAKETAPGAEVTTTEEPKVDEMVFVPAGEFIMGSNDRGKTNDIYLAYPEHKVNLKDYWIDKYEVTNSQFQDFAIKNKYIGEGAKEGKDWRRYLTPESALSPVISVSWNDAGAYCKAQGKRLPTEEEWEKAARGTDGRNYPWGNEWKENLSNTNETGNTKPVTVGQFKDVSPYGAYDMLGNVQEWTSSILAAYPNNPKKDNPDFAKKYRVLRGLSTNYIGKKGHIWDRSAWATTAIYNFGFRCAKDATPEDAANAAKNKK